jgi:DNA-binding response OmpR family regulator/nitrogen-specific signal transduction histidine kinase
VDKPDSNSEFKKARAEILVVEDSPTQAQKLAWLLEQANYSVRVAKNGRIALQYMSEQLPDLVITDVVMPEMDGYQLSESIREKFGLDVPVMLVTSLKSANDVLRGLKVGADNFLTKPYQTDYLLDQVDYLLSNKRLRGRRKMELGIEIEFAGERHFITADRQQILDLLISTYHEAVYLNQELECQSLSLKEQVELQGLQLQLSNELQSCRSAGELFKTSCQLLKSLDQIADVWICELTETSDARVVVSGSAQTYKSGSALKPCSCMKNTLTKAKNPSPATCSLTKVSEVYDKHICFSLQTENTPTCILNIFLTQEAASFDRLRTFFATSVQQIETNFQRISLLNNLERKVAQRTEELAASEKKFRAITESKLFGVIIIDETYSIEYQNQTAKELLNFTDLEKIKFPEKLNREKLPREFHPSIDSTWMGFPFAGEIYDGDGNPLPVLMMLSPLNVSTSSILVSFIDLTDLKQAEHKLAHMQRLESVASLSGGVAHDFNNLLSVIMGSTDILLDHKAKPQEKHDATLSIVRAATSGSELTNQLLTFAKQKPISGEKINIAQLFSGFAQFIGRLMPSNIALAVDCQDCGISVLADYSQLENVLLNLAVNARDAMPEGGELAITADFLQNVNDTDSISGTPIKGNFVKLEVRDTGTGIPDEIQEKVIEPFFTTKEEGKGTGLGLAMVYGFVKQCEGFFKIESRPGDTRIALYFPLFAQADDVVDKRQECDVMVDPDSKLILIVEDNEAVAAIIQKHISALGMESLITSSVNHAKEILDEKADEIDLILTDYFLDNGMTSKDIISHAQSICPEIPIILASGSDIDTNEIKVNATPNLKLLRKPYRRRQLQEIVKSLLGKKR